jgi:hypothetical protein
MVKPTQLEQATARLKLIKHLEQHLKVDRDVIAAAKAKLGADLCDSLSGELGKELLEQAEADIARLETPEFKVGDRVQWYFGRELRTSVIREIEQNALTVDFAANGYPGRHRVDPKDATPADLDELRQLRDACRTALGRVQPGPLGMNFPWAFREPEQYPSIELPED